MIRPMPPLPETFHQWLGPVLAVFSPRCRSQVGALALGALLAVGPRTVSNSLRVLGLAGRPDFNTFHRVLNRNAWPGLTLARRLAEALVQVFAPAGVLVIGVDHTLERRRGPRIDAAGHYYDPVRSSRGRTVNTRGLRWLSAMLLADVPFARRVWALPLLTVLTRRKACCVRRGQVYRPVTAWAARLLLVLRRWFPARPIVAVMDGEFAAVDLVRRLGRRMSVVTRLRLDARLFDLPEPCPAVRRGRKATKGPVQPKLSARLVDPAQPWQRFILFAQGGRRRTRRVEYLSGIALWHHPGKPVVPIRWVLVRYPEAKREPEAFLCTDIAADPLVILGWFSRRWPIEVTYEEVRAHLGVETQRQWSARAIARTTPLLFGLYSLVALYVQTHAGQIGLTPRRAAWYPKPTPTFAEALAAVRLNLWHGLNSVTGMKTGDTVQIPRDLFLRLLHTAAYAP